MKTLRLLTWLSSLLVLFLTGAAFLLPQEGSDDNLSNL